MVDAAPAADAVPFAAELDDLVQTHFATWLAEVLPPGPCLVWAGGPTLATVLAAAGDRTVLLVEPTTSRVEDALRRLGPGVRVRHAMTDSLATRDEVPGSGTYASAIVLPGTGDDPHALITSIAEHLAAGAAIAFRANPGVGDSVRATLASIGWPAAVVLQTVQAASCLALVSQDVITPLTSCGHVPGLGPTAAEAEIVVANVSPTPSILLGGDASPDRWWQGEDDLVSHLRALDQELATEDACRIRELEWALAAADAGRAAAEQQALASGTHVDELLASTSWRLTAPVRRVSALLRGR